MIKSARKILLLLLIVLPTVSFASDLTLTQEGRALLFSENGPTFQDILDANQKFAAAVSANPADQEANLFYALSQISVFFLESQQSGEIKTLSDLADAAGMPIDLLIPVGQGLPFGDMPQTNGYFTPPETMPKGDDVTALFETHLPAVLDNALVSLNKIDANNGDPIVILTSEELRSTSNVEIDYTDVLACKAAVHFLKTFVFIMAAYDLDNIDAREIFALENAGMTELKRPFLSYMLGRYPNFLTLRSDVGVSLLDQAKSSFKTGSGLLSDCYNNLLDEVDSQEDDFIVFETLEDQEEFETVLAYCGELVDALNGEFEYISEQGVEEHWTLNLNAHDFFNDPLFLRVGEDRLLGSGRVASRWGWWYGRLANVPWGGKMTHHISGSNFSATLFVPDGRTIDITGTFISETEITNVSFKVKDIYDEVVENGSGYDGGRTYLSEEDVDRFDINALFGGNGKSPLDIRASLPNFNAEDEPVAGTFPEPIFNGIFPDYNTNDAVTEKLDLDLDLPQLIVQIPDHTIDISQDPANWPQDTHVGTDNDTDGAPNASFDLTDIYAAKDSQFIYIGMRLAGSPASLSGEQESATYSVDIRKNPNDRGERSLQFGLRYEQERQEWAAFFTEYGDQGWDNYQPAISRSWGTDHFYRGSDFVVLKIPLNDESNNDQPFFNLDDYRGWAITAQANYFIRQQTSPDWYWMEYMGGDWMDQQVRLGPVFSIEGNVAIPEGYSGGNIYIYASDQETLGDGADAIAGTLVLPTSTNGAFTLDGIPYNSGSLNIFVLWDTNGNGFMDAGDLVAKQSTSVTGDVELGTISHDTEVLPIPIEYAGVMGVHSTGGNYRTYFHLCIKDAYGGTVPDSISRITVTYPYGYTEQIYPNGIMYHDGGNEFFGERQGFPVTGTYTFTVYGTDGSMGTVTDVQKDLYPMPIVDVSKVQFDTSALTPVFTWEPVQPPSGDVAYRLEVRATDGSFSFRTNRNLGMTSCTLPQLAQGVTYEYRIRATDSSSLVSTDNRSQTDWIAFTMADQLHHDAKAAIDPDGWGAVMFSRNGEAPGLDLWVKLVDMSGVSYDGTSHNVIAQLWAQGTMLGEGPLVFQYNDGPLGGYYAGFVPAEQLPASVEKIVFKAGIAGGDYTVSLTDTLSQANFSVSGNQNLSCIENGTSPQILWDEVSGATRYVVRIYDADSNVVYKGYPEKTNHYTVPPGILSAHTQYWYCLDVRDSHSGFETDNAVRIPGNFNEFPSFTTGDVCETPLIDPDGSGVQTWSNAAFGSVLDFWIQVHDAQGALDNIEKVEVIHPDGQTVTQLKADSRSSFTSYYYSCTLFVPPKAGTYTFVVTDKDGNIAEMTEDLTVSPLPVPSISSLKVTETETSARFEWDGVDGAAFYRVEVYNQKGNRIYKFYSTSTSYEAPIGLFNEGTRYSFRVVARDKFFEQNVDNASAAPWRKDYTVDFKVGNADEGTAAPQISLGSKGVVVYQTRHPVTGQPAYGLEFSAAVFDADGVPGNIKSVVVEGDGITGSLALSCNSNTGVGAEYVNLLLFDDFDAIPEGTYIFTVTDEAGNIAQATDTLAKTQVPIAAYVVPADKASVSADRPLIAWKPQGSEYRHRICIFGTGGGVVDCSGFLAASSYLVPENVLEPGKTYGYQIQTYVVGELVSSDIDNFAISQLPFETQNHFTVNGDPRTLHLIETMNLLKLMGGKAVDLPDDAVNVYDIDGDGKLEMEDMLPKLP